MIRYNPAIETDGFVVLRGLVGEGDLDALGAEVEDVLARPLPPGCAREHNTLAPLRWDSPIVERVLGDERRVMAVGAAAGASDLRWISGYVSVKDPRSAALEWHQDWWCWGHPVSFRAQAPQVALLCYLSATTAANGALRLLPGSHHRGMPLPAALAGARTLALDAGDAVLIDYRLLHGTHPNTSDARRDCLILNFAPAWRSLPSDVRGHLIRHPALPGEGEPDVDPPYPTRLLPDFAGEPRDLPLIRDAPASFAI